MHYEWLLPLVLGFVGIYILLPRPRARLTMFGIVAVGLAIVLCGIWVLHWAGNVAEAFLFYAFSAVAIIGGIQMLAQRNPVHAALSFSLVVLSSCGLFLLNSAPFLMAATIIIYAGAVVVTFLFVIMLSQQEGIASADQRSREPLMSALAGFVLLTCFLFLIHKSYDDSEINDVLSDVHVLSKTDQPTAIAEVLGSHQIAAHKLDKDAPESRSDRFQRLLRSYLPGETDVDNLDAAWASADVPRVNSLAASLEGKLHQRRPFIGSLIPPASMPISPNAGPPANVPFTLRSDGSLPERLPARNVAGLGRAIFTDYLIPVEMAGMLLLVATIGAIAIAARRTEGLR